MSGPDVDQQLVLRQALGRLAPRQRAVIVLRYFDDLTEAQTAEALGISVGTVKSQAATPRPAAEPGARPCRAGAQRATRWSSHAAVTAASAASSSPRSRSTITF